ncbi:MAG: hypothetical protein ABI759_25475 [Candidatus Solibacter sp.]
MSSTTQDELYRKFLEVSGQQTSDTGTTLAMLSDILAQYNEMKKSLPQATSTSTTKAASSSTTNAASQASQDKGGSLAGTIASTLLKSGFGLAPLVSGIVSLFGGGGTEAPPALVKYAMPDGIQFQAAESRSQLTPLDYDQFGLARSSSPPRQNNLISPGSNSAGQQITVNVQAMDARSFLDRSNDIALAVRDAMLNLNAINDVVNEL